MLLHRLRTICAYLTGIAFCLWAAAWCRHFRVRGLLRCYGWPVLQAGDGSLEIGRRVCFGRVKLILAKGGCIRVGHNVAINDGVVLGSLSKISIGNGTSIAEYVMIRDHDHDYSAVPVGEKPPGYIAKDVTIGTGCWLGYGSIILKGVAIDDGAIIGAGAVVTRDVPTGAIVGGNPAQVIRFRNK